MPTDPFSALLPLESIWKVNAGMVKPGRLHDKRLGDEENETFPPGWVLLKATGGQGVEPDRVSTDPPQKKPRQHARSAAETAANTIMARIRILFDVRYLVSYLSQLLTLAPGDLIATGTPAGVGFSRKPPVTLQPGDTVRLEVTGLGVLENPIKDA